jgi:hypothetical protein
LDFVADRDLALWDWQKIWRGRQGLLITSKKQGDQQEEYLNLFKQILNQNDTVQQLDDALKSYSNIKSLCAVANLMYQLATTEGTPHSL